jgi:hypothetical protein
MSKVKFGINTVYGRNVKHYFTLACAEYFLSGIRVVYASFTKLSDTRVASNS